MTEFTEVDEQGYKFTLFKRDGFFELVTIGNPSVANLPGVTCENSDSPENERIYKRVFTKNKIYMPDEYEQATTVVFSGKDTIVLGMNGFSRIKYKEWGVEPGVYESACENLFAFIIRNMQKTFEGMNICLANGASNLGVDVSSWNISEKFNLPLLAHSCPKYLIYVLDNGMQVYVAEDEKKYSDAFVESLDILITANGGQITYKHDIDAAFNRGKHVIPLKVLQAISFNGGPPAFDSEGKVVDAVSAYEQRVHMMGFYSFNANVDKWEAVKSFSSEQIIAICRQKLSPTRAFHF